MGKTININDVILNYEEVGEGDIILFLHGYALHLESLKYSTEPLFDSSSFKRIYVDLPGMGQSTYNDSVLNSDDILSCLIVFIQQVIKQQPFSVVGFSYGGYLARGIAAKLPSQVRGLALICPVIKANYKERILPPSKVAYEDKEYLKTLDEETLEDIQFLVVRSKRVIQRTLTEFFSNDNENDEYLMQVQKLGYAFKEDVDLEVGSTTIPALFLLGRNDNITGYEDAFHILTHYPNATYVVLNNTGHNLYIEQETLFNKHMKAWLHTIK